MLARTHSTATCTQFIDVHTHSIDAHTHHFDERSHSIDECMHSIYIYIYIAISININSIHNYHNKKTIFFPNVLTCAVSAKMSPLLYSRIYHKQKSKDHSPVWISI